MDAEVGEYMVLYHLTLQTIKARQEEESKLEQQEENSEQQSSRNIQHKQIQRPPEHIVGKYITNEDIEEALEDGL